MDRHSSRVICQSCTFSSPSVPDRCWCLRRLLSAGGTHLHQTPPEHRGFLHLLLVSDTSVLQLTISLKTFDKSCSPKGIWRDSLNPQLGQTHCHRVLTDLGAVCLCSSKMRQCGLDTLCTVRLAISLGSAGFNGVDTDFVWSAILLPSLTSSNRGGWLNKWRASALESGWRKT